MPKNRNTAWYSTATYAKGFFSKNQEEIKQWNVEKTYNFNNIQQQFLYKLISRR